MEQNKKPVRRTPPIPAVSGNAPVPTDLGQLGIAVTPVPSLHHELATKIVSGENPDDFLASLDEEERTRLGREMGKVFLNVYFDQKHQIEMLNQEVQRLSGKRRLSKLSR